jgi:hypothetical protein
MEVLADGDPLHVIVDSTRTFEVVKVQQLGPHLCVLVTDSKIDAILKRLPGERCCVGGDDACPNLSVWAGALVGIWMFCFGE